jgi:heme-degrading monooxygenase HmoA
MICRMWRGWTASADAEAYEAYLEVELFPRLQAELTNQGYRGYHLLRLETGAETEFVTLVWFESLRSVQSFAGTNYEVPVISEKAHRWLVRYAERCEHYELNSFHWPAPAS